MNQEATQVLSKTALAFSEEGVINTKSYSAYNYTGRNKPGDFREGLGLLRNAGLTR